MKLVPTVISLILSIWGAASVSLALHKCRRNQFYSDTFNLSPLGIFVYGDGLILGPFWVLIGLAGLILQPSLLWLSRLYLLFWIIRSSYEVIYWLSSQAANTDYTPPLGRNTEWLGRNDARILYQLIHTCVVVVGLALLLFSFTL